MERLTCKFEEENVLRGMCTFDRESETDPDDCLFCGEICESLEEEGCQKCIIQEAFDRLAAYEDTGLTPEQIVEMDRLYAEKCRELAERRKGWIPCSERLPSKEEFKKSYCRNKYAAEGRMMNMDTKKKSSMKI